MFTGIVEETGVVRRIEPTKRSIRLSIACKICGQGLKLGDSLAVNGCCLTVVKITKSGTTRLVEFDLLRETWNRTNFHTASEGAAVNLERSLRLEDRFGGHFVTGHVDGTGRIVRWEKVGSDWALGIDAGKEIVDYVVSKGTVAVDGISLTIAEVKKQGFLIWIIPHTYEVTALRERKVGSLVNLEADLLGKYVSKLLDVRGIRSRK